MASNIETVSIVRKAGTFSIRAINGEVFSLHVTGAPEPIETTGTIDEMVAVLESLERNISDLRYDAKYNPDTYVTDYYAKKREAAEAAEAAKRETVTVSTEADNEPF